MRGGTKAAPEKQEGQQVKFYKKCMAYMLGAAMMLPALPSGIRTAHAESDFAVSCDFEDGTVDMLTLGTHAGDVKITNETEENGNKFARITITSDKGKSTNLDEMPDIYISPDFGIEPGSKTRISMKMRINDTSALSRDLVFNHLGINSYSQLKSNVIWNMGNATWSGNRGCEIMGLTMFDQWKNGSLQSYPGSNFYMNNPAKDNWYKVDMTLYASVAGNIVKYDVKWTDEEAGTTLWTLSNRALQGEKESIPLYNLTAIETLGLNLKLEKASVSDVKLDIDDFMVYSESLASREAKVLYRSGEKAFFNTDSISIAFSGKMDKNTMNGENIKLYRDGTEIPYTPIAGDFKYTMKFDENLESGTYNIVFDTSAVMGLDADGNTISVLQTGSIDGIKVYSGNIPEARDLLASGTVAEGETLRAEYTYYQEDGIDGNVEISWQYSDDGKNFLDIPGAVGDEYTVAAEYADKYIRFCALPIRDDGLPGKEQSSNVLLPPLAPTAKNVTVGGIAAVGMTLEAQYDFEDQNGDEEGSTKYQWYSSDNGTDFEKIDGQTRKKYLVSDDMTGKYVKVEVTPHAVVAPQGKPVMSASSAQIGKDVYSVTNLMTNHSFEDGETGWKLTYYSSDPEPKFEVVDFDAYDGTHCAAITKRTQNTTNIVSNPVSVKAGVTYLFSSMAKVHPDASVDYLNFTESVTMSGEEKVDSVTSAASKDDWTRIWKLSYSTQDTTARGVATCWPSGSKGYDYLLDDIYIGPLVVADIPATVPEKIEIPAQGETTEKLLLGKAINQVGTTAGLENETTFWRVDSADEGVYVEDNILHVTDEAVGGVLYLEAVCNPQFKGASQSTFTKIYPIELVANSSKAPRVLNLNLSGTVEEGKKLTATYKFYQVDNEPGTCDVEWLWCDTEDGVYKVIEGAAGDTYVVSAEYKDYFIKVRVTPKTASETGESVTSYAAAPKTAPKAENVRISGKAFVGETLAADFDWSDVNKDDNRAQEKYQWYRSDNENDGYVMIDGADGKNYVLTTDDVNKFIKVEVTPASDKEPYYGMPKMNEKAFSGPTPPTAKNLSITRNGSRLSGYYEFSQKDGAVETQSICNWYVNGKKVATGTDYTIAFSGTRAVTFEVIPVADKEPSVGEAASITKNITAGGGSGGSGGGGGGTSIPWTNNTPVIEKKDEPTDQPQTTQPKDLAGHWAESYAKNAVEKGIMGVDSENKFNPDKLVTRSEMITYIFKAMGYSETAYKNEFGDVGANDKFANMLQTMVDKGIISRDVNFRPNDNVSRQEVAKILCITLGLTDKADINVYQDKDLIGDWAKEHVAAIVNSKLMTGISVTAFSPRTNITNGQIAKIVTMILEKSYTGSGEQPQQPSQPADTEEQTLINTKADELTVAFIGGSLTQGGSTWENATAEELKKKLGVKNIQIVNAGLNGTVSEFGASRFSRDVTPYNPDIVFIEFAVNDKNFDALSAKLYMEQMVMQCNRMEKRPAVVFLFAPLPTETVAGTLQSWETGVASKQELADYYGIKTVNIHDYMMRDYEKQKASKPSLTLSQYYDPMYRKTGPDEWDVHGGYEKYAEAIIEAMNEDINGFIKTPKNKPAMCAENQQYTEYTSITASDDKITYFGDWIKRSEPFIIGDDNASLNERHFEMFKGGIMQAISAKSAGFEFKTDADAIRLAYVTSKAGCKAVVYVDGKEAGTWNTASSIVNFHFPHNWIELPKDGKKHTVKVALDEPTETNYVFNMGTIIERRKK